MAIRHPSPRPAGQRQLTAGCRGFTLIEAMVAILVAAVLMGIAVPGLKGFMARRAVNAAISELAADYRLARNEALRRTNNVTICRSVDGATCAAPATFGSWHDGWILFVDNDANRQVNGADEVFRIRQALPGIESIRTPGDINYQNTVPWVVFRPNGISFTGNDTLLVTADATVPGGARTVVISRNGRMKVNDVGAP
jgi:type IV fimbrial biogenesis protein FimT